jgi:hypothetical protein
VSFRETCTRNLVVSPRTLLHRRDSPLRLGLTPLALTALVHAGDHDADAVGRGADATALVATDFPGSADRRTAGNTHRARRFTEDVDARGAKRSADTTAFVAAILSGAAEGCSARLTGGWPRRAVLARAHLAEAGTLAAALIAAVLAGTTHFLIARLADTEVLGSWDLIGNADAAALRATGRALNAENCRAWVVINRQADS